MREALQRLEAQGIAAHRLRLARRTRPRIGCGVSGTHDEVPQLVHQCQPRADRIGIHADPR